MRLVEAGAGALLVLLAIVLWLVRARMTRRLADGRVSTGRSAFLLGAGIMATELPTAVPYFGALVAITEGAHRASWSFVLVILYNLVFVAPLLVLLAVVVAAGEWGAALAVRLRAQLIRYGPVLTPLLLGALGVALLVAGLR